MKNEFLPAGSVVLLKKAKRPVIIIGYATVENGNKEIWDYLGCAYPIGVVSSDSNLLFNSNEIDKVLHTGYTDEEGTLFRKELKENIEMIRDKK